MSANAALSELFHTFSQLMEIKGENRFKVIAFQKVGRVLGEVPFDVIEEVKKGKLPPIEGVGESSRKIIEEFAKTGRSADFESVSNSVPAGLIPLLRIPSLGPKTISQLWKERGIIGMEDLVKAIDSGALAGLKGLGEKKIQSIKDGIKMAATANLRIGIAEALPIAEALVERLRKLKQVKQAEMAGSLRRRAETIGDVDLICALVDPNAGEEVAAAFVAFPEVAKINAQGITKASIVTAGGLQVDLRMVPQENFGAALLYFTGSKAHNVKIRGMAVERGMTLNEWGLYEGSGFGVPATADLRQGSGKKKERTGVGVPMDSDKGGQDLQKKEAGKPPKSRPLASKTEAEVYAKLGLAFVEPELREDRGEVEAAGEGKLPGLIQLTDIRGDLHMHTTASDGTASIEQMAEAAMAKGYEYIAITDHSKSQVIAKGLDADRLRKHIAEVRRADDRIKGIKILAGSEVDILVDGRMDYEDAILAELDIVIASPHISLKQEPGKATDRLLRAIDNRYVTVIGHPTGRLILRREGLSPDFSRLFAAAAANGTAMEINASYPRLDLNDLNSRNAIRAGVMLSINTDSHSTDELEEMKYGISVARRAWANRENVINCLSFKELQKFIGRKRNR